MKSTIWSRGDFFIWVVGAGLAVSLIMVTGLLSVIIINGLSGFWPREMNQFVLNDGSFFFGQEVERESGEDSMDRVKGAKIKIKRGNRDLYGMDFIWIDAVDLTELQKPMDVAVFERLEWGDFYGLVKEVRKNGKVFAKGNETGWSSLMEHLPYAQETYNRILEIRKDKIGAISHAMESLRLEKKKLELKGILSGPAKDNIESELESWHKKYQIREKEILELKSALVYTVVLADAEGREKEIALHEVVRAYHPNTFGSIGAIKFFMEKLCEFLFEDPREANTEGGVFPAIFGTVMMVFLMSLFAAPFGVLAALYLREYAKPGPFVSLVRIAVNNLAGVPSIVFGVFGVGFFIYAVGGTIDQLFFPEALPTPTFGTGGILWASLTLALLTVPVVIVATEEGLAAVPPSIREGSLALGATKFETLWRAVFPAVLPSILTGLILAMARAAGEVAPLMITGVVKLAPSLPIDGNWPFVHLERKFMHLGFHIYDVGFQSPNVDAARHMVYTTTLLLIILVLLLNWAAIVLRGRLRKKLYVAGL